MRKAIAIIVAVLFVFAVTSISFAAEEKKAEGAVSVEKPKVKQVTGEVKAVDTKAGTITVAKKMKGKVEETIVTVDNKTKIMMGKEKKTLADVMAGDKVTAKYTEVDGKNVAKSVAIKEAETAPAEKKAEPAKKK
jgi:Cu/Ag efflux protein CusF